MRWPLIRASSCWLYSIIFVAVYGSIIDPFLCSHHCVESGRVFAVWPTPLSTSDATIVCHTGIVVIVTWADFSPDRLDSIPSPTS